MPIWCPATVESKQVWAEGLFTLKIRCPEIEAYEPGQFLHLALTEGEHLINRPYSVASPPGGLVEFFIVVVPTGKLTPKLWQLQPGDPVQISQKGAGSFTLAKAPALRDLWLISTGTGLAPYIAMLRAETVWQKYEKIIVAHGVRHAHEFGYREELKALETRYPGRFVYLGSTSRETCPQCLTGRLTICLEDGSLERAAQTQFSPEHSAVMLCGNPEMLDHMEQMLEARGLKKHRHKVPGNIVVERYW